MARTDHHRPYRLRVADQPHLGPFAGTGGRTPHQKAAHRRDRAAARLALRTGAEPPRTSRRRVDRDTH